MTLVVYVVGCVGVLVIQALLKKKRVCCDNYAIVLNAAFSVFSFSFEGLGFEPKMNITSLLC